MEVDLDVVGPDGIPLNFTCYFCGNDVDIQDPEMTWAHECFTVYDRAISAIAADDENRLSIVSKQLLDEALARGQVVNISVASNESDNSVSILEDSDEPTESVKYMKLSNASRKKASKGNKLSVQQGNKPIYSDETKEAIILSVKKRTLLWNFVGEEVKDRDRFSVATEWLSVTGEIGELSENAQWVKKEWETLRRQYWAAHGKVCRPSGTATQSLGTQKAVKTSFKFYQLMSFLSDVAKPPPTVSSMPSSSSSVQKTVNYYNDVCSKMANQTQTPSKSARRTSTPKSSQSDDLEREIISVLRTESSKPQDAITGLLLMIDENVRKFPEDKRLTVVMRFMKLLEECTKEFLPQ
ncbi:hypothetical protein QAD02_006732 [Eretmocerus hayati]|uniref:Uncharacterized protein n=1 Tax=Eretmocerus hayati TaxID=131215 RepID=A0ACC2N5Z7_9HYME|nr:hypothetical protein QAD02_006732 [Eretmocerus hayati]